MGLGGARGHEKALIQSSVPATSRDNVSLTPCTLHTLHSKPLYEALQPSPNALLLTLWCRWLLTYQLKDRTNESRAAQIAEWPQRSPVFATPARIRVRVICADSPSEVTLWTIYMAQVTGKGLTRSMPKYIELHWHSFLVLYGLCASLLARSCRESKNDRSKNEFDVVSLCSRHF